MDRFLFGGCGLSSIFHVSLILSLSLSVSHFTPSLSTNLMQENRTGALQVHSFFIWRLTTLASSSLDWDPALSQKSVARKTRGRAGGDGESEEERGELESGRKFSVGGESVYARVLYVRR